MGQLQYLLHGTLYLTIYEAESLAEPDTANASAPAASASSASSASKVFKKMLRKAQSAVGVSIPTAWNALYATIDIERIRVARTRILRPPYTGGYRWNESFCINCAHFAANVVVSIKNDNAVGATLIGRAKVPVTDLISGNNTVAGWYRLFTDDNQPVKNGCAKVRLRLRYADLKSSPAPSLARGVSNTYFKQRSGCRVTLYHDAHVPSDPAETRCWVDVFEHISAARHLIYIAGWSVYTQIRLIRDPAFTRRGSDQSLGELLRAKADAGVRVLMLVWDDRTSVEWVRKQGVMATHDQETLDYFHGTKVQCVLCARDPDDGNSMVQGMKTAAMFTHHQKTITVDAPSSDGSRRRIVSFVGGIDLCNGRYDTPEHTLFKIDPADFHQPNFESVSAEKGGPREPWHDIHCKLEGPAAWDVLHNFEQRWARQGSNKDLLVRLSQVNVSGPRAVVRDSHADTWNVQVLRSIDGGAADFRYRTPSVDVAAAGLLSGKDNTIERSIQDAYVAAIRASTHFIYIENQYFLGSCYAWTPEPDPDVGALHIIPKELSLKIVSKIEAGERFCVYVVLPMWPEGPPASASVQAILHWQTKTMQMMYADVAQALSAKQMHDVSPTDYLAFFCLCNRERAFPSESSPPQAPEPGSDYRSAQEHRRFMIYVHSKMMIVDDEYVIVGSANINQRSMDGARDSEIAMLAYQPNQLRLGLKRRRSKSKRTNGGGMSQGEIQRFRMRLWKEHMNASEECFSRADSVECIRKVRSIGERTREVYVREGGGEIEVPAHLMSYPVTVADDGSVKELPGFHNFPDTKAPVLGTRSQVLPPILTA